MKNIQHFKGVNTEKEILINYRQPYLDDLNFLWKLLQNFLNQLNNGFKSS
jgi:hypothetical protein